MYLFKPEFLIQHLRTLTDSSDDVKTLALFVNTYNSNFQIILEILDNEFTKSNYKHKTLILELANEILLQSTDTNTSTLAAKLKNYIPIWYANLFDIKNNSIKQKLGEMKKNWLEKKMFEDKDFEIKRKKTENNYTKEKMLEMVNMHYDDKKKLKKYFDDYFMDDM
ncbi:hypothetical protein BDAP_001192 [Binucleata daphniae]